jgi:hypothetical protein
MDRYMYTGLAALAVLLFYVERRAIQGCDNIYDPNTLCRYPQPKIDVITEPLETDSVDVLSSKITKIALFERESVKWRRCLFLAIIISFALFLLIVTPGSLPAWNILYATTCTIFFSYYCYCSWQSHHIYNVPAKNAILAVTMLKSKL